MLGERLISAESAVSVADENKAKAAGSSALRPTVWRDKYVLRFSGWKASQPDTGLPPPSFSRTSSVGGAGGAGIIVSNERHSSVADGTLYGDTYKPPFHIDVEDGNGDGTGNLDRRKQTDSVIDDSSGYSSARSNASGGYFSNTSSV